MGPIAQMTICPACDLVQHKVHLDAGESAYCVRCSEELACGPSNNTDIVRALLLTALILIVLMNVFPLVEMRINGIARVTTLLGAIHTLYTQDMNFLALLVLGTTILCPAIEILLLMLMVLRPAVAALRLPGNRLFRVVHSLQSWSMVEVFMLGVLVALVKLAALAEIILGPAIGACIGLIVTITVLKRIVRPEQLWRFHQEANG